ncbi:MAG TPA: beta-propeller fold lactonase family protein [Stellaceae bacterium]|nr:beta-propeller fold lactonase family protein [Stellaceae bacterium]
MADLLYVGLQDDDRIAVFAIDSDGGLTPRAEIAAAGGPSVFAIAPDRRTLYVGHRTRPAIASWRIDGAAGSLTPLGTTAQADAPTFLAPDRTGRCLLAAYYQGGYAAVYPVAADGAVGTTPSDKQATAIGAHAIATDPTNRFAFVPHIARIQDNVMEPAKNNPGPNVILQFRFDVQSGRLAPNSPSRVEQAALIGPRHYTFHPQLGVVYFSNEQGCSVTAYHLDAAAGTLAAMQTISSLPAGHAERTTCSQIHLTPSGRFLYVGNRAAGSSNIAGFTVDAASGRLTAAGHAATEAVPSAFCLDPTGRFLYAVGTASGRLASYRIDQQSGVLAPIGVQAVGRRPAAILAAQIGA